MRGTSVACPHSVPVPRIWNVVLHQHDDASFTARVRVDGKLLRPDCVACTGPATIAYLQEALIDVREADELAVRAQGKGGIRTAQVTDAAQAVGWFQQQIPVEVPSDDTAPGAKSGTRPIVRPRPLGGQPKPDSQAS